MTETVIQTRELTKKYGDFTAVDRLNLNIRAGEVFGVLGPNGAGKTTTILMLLGLTEPTSGEVRVLGFDPSRQPLQVKARVGYVPDAVGFYDELTARENLVYIAKLNGLSRAEMYPRIDEALARVGLSDVADHAVRTFSRGMRQRLGVADVLIKRPRIVILDEPTQGMDPERAREFLDIIRNLRHEGITVLLSSHLLHQVQAVCDRVGLFHRGRMVLEGTVTELAQRVLGGAYRIHVEVDEPTDAIVQALEAVPEVLRVRPNGANGAFVLDARQDVRPQVAAQVVQAGGQLLRLDVETPTLDEIYTRYFQEVRDGEAES